MFNERIWHAEEAVFRAVTGQTSNFPNGNGTYTRGTFPAKGTIPKAVTKTGTIQSTGVNVLGTGTTFVTDVKVGDYLYDPDATASAVRKVKEVTSDTRLILEQGFPVDINAGSPLAVCEKQYFVAVYAKSTGTVEAELQEAPFPAGETFMCGGAPVAYDASGTDEQISFECHK